MQVDHTNRANAGLLPSNYNNQSSSTFMRKYQQLALAIICILSLLAFLFYKHAYDRLHFAFEYLETFGTTGDENSLNFCGSKAFRKLYTTPSYWQILSHDLAIYSTSWDMKSSTLLALVLFRGKHNASVSIMSENNVAGLTMQCILKPEVPYKNIGLMACSPHLKIRKPFLAMYKVNKDVAAHSTFVQISEKWKGVANTSCICVFSTGNFVGAEKLLEFIAYHNAIGIEKFVFYGNLLAPTIRKILDMNEDEMGIFYEEKEFNVPVDFNLTVKEYRKIVEMDCAMRHKNLYENVIALQPNEYIVIKGNPSLNNVISSVPITQTKLSSVLKFKMKTQNACYEDFDASKPFVSMNLKMLDDTFDDNIAIIRPHLVFDGHFNQSLYSEQDIPMTRLSVYNFVSCSSHKLTTVNSLAMNNSYFSLIEKSLLYKKWKIYDI